MIIYNPHNESLLKERLIEAEKILDQIPVKHCFISGSFLFKDKYEDIDLFVVSRSKKTLRVKNKKVKITVIDFNTLYSLFYHSVSKSCISKNILPTRPLKVTMADYWQVINEAIPVLLNQKNKFHKSIRFLVLYTEYFKTGEVLDTFQLSRKVSYFSDHKEILGYIKSEAPALFKKKIKLSYMKKFFYTQAGFYKDFLEYNAQNFLYNLTHVITKGVTFG
ncbi:hypothetical protein HY837_02480 [archaeon]|nr:hypothetical protein [archaeon]